MEVNKFRKFFIAGVITILVLLVLTIIFSKPDRSVILDKENYQIVYDNKSNVYQVNPKAAMSAEDIANAENDLKNIAKVDNLTNQSNIDFEIPGVVRGTDPSTIEYLRKEAEANKDGEEEIKKEIGQSGHDEDDKYYQQLNNEVDEDADFEGDGQE